MCSGRRVFICSRAGRALIDIRCEIAPGAICAVSSYLLPALPTMQWLDVMPATRRSRTCADLPSQSTALYCSAVSESEAMHSMYFLCPSELQTSPPARCCAGKAPPSARHPVPYKILKVGISKSQYQPSPCLRLDVEATLSALRDGLGYGMAREQRSARAQLSRSASQHRVRLLPHGKVGMGSA